MGYFNGDGGSYFSEGPIEEEDFMFICTYCGMARPCGEICNGCKGRDKVKVRESSLFGQIFARIDRVETLAVHLANKYQDDTILQHFAKEIREEAGL